MRPQRIQRKRTKGWRMPPGAVYVGRPTIFGNPFRPQKIDGLWVVVDDNGVTYRPLWNTEVEANYKAFDLFRRDVYEWGRLGHDAALAEAIRALRGKDLACWCPEGRACHANVLLDIANGDQP